MIPDSRRTDFGGDSEDRISSLPINVVDCILELLPVEDAARTSILSTKWRYIWASLSNLVLDKRFCQKFSGKAQSVRNKTIDVILFQHIGDVVKFTLDVSKRRLSSYRYIDRWMHYVTRNNVRQLIVYFPKANTYKLPSYIFNCHTLTVLKLSNCIFKPPNSFPGFKKLTTLQLDRVTFIPTSDFCVIKAPLLANLALHYCDGTQYLNIVSSKLVRLVVFKSPYLILDNFLKCKTLRTIEFFHKVADNTTHPHRSIMEKLLSLPGFLVLFCLPGQQFLSVDTIMKKFRLPFKLDCVWSLLFHADLSKVDQTSYALQLIKCSPNLRELEIWNESTGDDAETVLEYLSTLTYLDGPLSKLKHVNIYCFRGSKLELFLVKLLFARAPSLVRMSIRRKRAFSSLDERITTELMRFPRASPNAELVYLPSLS